MNAQQLASEIDDALQRGLKIAWNVTIEHQIVRAGANSREQDAILQTLRQLMTERARNLAQAYADRIQDEPDELLHGPLED